MGETKITKKQIIDIAHDCGFGDVGFTSAEPFETHREFLQGRQPEYGWAEKIGLALMDGTDPSTILKNAKTVIVLMEVYMRNTYPTEMENHFGRCYLDDDRVTKDGLAKRIRSFRGELIEHGIKTKCPFNLPHRVAAARAGMGTFGKNCLFYSNKVARKSSWVLPIAIVIDKEFEPDTPTVEMGCPAWCKNACIAACPTRALKGNGTIDPRKCISYLTYFGKGLTPLELREPMGLMIYGCDRCQNVCPRNAPWLAKAMPLNPRVETKAPDFALPNLLHMDKPYFESKIWPHMFYMDSDHIWQWKMNTARVMGNTHDRAFVTDLIKALDSESDERVRAMAAWALGRLGGEKARQNLDRFSKTEKGIVKKEINLALA
ncbi:MAG: HEAT repeat domain-containing protein [Desulfobacterales bacterium]|nr:HEAT repeat domain-containing protein [Desulfobacterales bacterium]